MTTLVFPEHRSHASTDSSPAVSLREWLGEHWGIVFSHPGDFEQEQVERDRWIHVLRRTFDAHEVRALALARDARDAREKPHGWLAELGDDCAAMLAMTQIPHGALLDLRSLALRAAITRSGTRFAMVIDDELRCRRTLRYRMAVDLPSPIELVGWAVALRDRRPHAVASRHPASTDFSTATAVGSRSLADDSLAKQAPETWLSRST